MRVFLPNILKKSQSKQALLSKNLKLFQNKKEALVSPTLHFAYFLIPGPTLELSLSDNVFQVHWALLQQATMMSMLAHLKQKITCIFSNIVAQSCLVMRPHLLSWLPNWKPLISVFEGKAQGFLIFSVPMNIMGDNSIKLIRSLLQFCGKEIQENEKQSPCKINHLSHSINR